MPTDITPPLQLLLDKDAIRDVLHRVCRGLDRADGALLERCYHADATEVHGDFEGDAATWRAGAMARVPETFERMRHSLGTINIDVEGDHALAESYFTAGCLLRSDSEPRTVSTIYGRYLDRFERRQDEWRIAHRVVVKDYRDIRPIHDVVEGYPLSQWGTDDLVYRLGSP